MLHELDELLAVVNQHTPDSIGVKGNIHLYKGIFAYYDGRVAKSMQESEEALVYFQQQPQKYLEDISSIYNNLGVLYMSEGNLNKAEDYMKKALSLKEEFRKLGRPFNEVANLANYLNLSRICYGQKRYDEFKAYMDILEANIEETPTTPPSIRYQVNQKLARYYLRNEPNDTLAAAYLRRLDELASIADIEQFDLTNTDHLRAEYFLVLNDSAKASEIIVSATQELEEMLGHDKPLRLAEYYINVAEFFGRLKQYDQAMYWSEKAIALSQSTTGSDLVRMNGQQLQTYAAAIGNKACLNYFHKGANETARLKAIEKLGGQYVSTLRVFANRSDKVIALDGYLDFNTVVTALMEVKYQKHKDDPSAFLEAMELLELKQGLPLLKNRKDVDIAQAAGVDPRLTQRMNEIEIELARLRTNYSPSNTSETNTQIANELDRFNKEKDSLSGVIKTHITEAGYPLMDPVATEVSPSEVKSVIQKDECLLQFLNDRSELYVTVYSNDTQFIYYSDEVTLNDELQKMRAYLGDLEAYDQDSFLVYSHLLYKRLIQPFEDHIKGKDLVIMPTGSFNYVPFEVLIRDTELNKPDYLLRHHAIRYVYSVKARNSKERTRKQATCIAFAPDFGNKENQGFALRDGFDPLLGARKEIEHISNSYPFEQFVDQDASKALFIDKCKSSRIIHLASHAVVNEQYPLRSYVVFDNQNATAPNDQYLYAYELYEMKLDADMAVLSACNTGIGKLSTFDGVISLAKAFEFAGVRSTLMSLWPAQDDATAEIMKEFYQNLAAGDRKSRALQKAKLTYLNNADPVAAQPFFWASFVLQGDNTAIPNSKNPWPFVLAGVGSLVLIYFVFSRRRSRRSA